MESIREDSGSEILQSVRSSAEETPQRQQHSISMTAAGTGFQTGDKRLTSQTGPAPFLRRHLLLPAAAPPEPGPAGPGSCG